MALLERTLDTPVKRRLDVETYIAVSSVAAIFLQQRIAHSGVDIFLGYPLVLLNAAILLAMDRLLIHRNHAIVIGIATLMSVIASIGTDTPTMSIVAQVTGICVFSIYYFSVLTTMHRSVPRWMEMYAQMAIVIAVFGIVEFMARLIHLLPPAPGDDRLHSIFSEPSFFVYLTLPAIGLYVAMFLRTRQYKMELLVFMTAYIMADSTLGWLGLLAVAFFAAASRLSFGKLLAFGVVAATVVTGLFFVNYNFQRRVVDTFYGAQTLDLTYVNASSFGMITNAYVTVQSFLDHPILGLGLGGYQFAYSKYITQMIGLDPDLVTLNMYDASSLYLRAAAELGIIGLVSLITFLVVCARVRGDQFKDIRNALLPYLLIRMLRYGAWFSLELYFFVGLYLLNYLQSRAAYKQLAPPAETAPIGASSAH